MDHSRSAAAPLPRRTHRLVAALFVAAVLSGTGVTLSAGAASALPIGPNCRQAHEMAEAAYGAAADKAQDYFDDLADDVADDNSAAYAADYNAVSFWRDQESTAAAIIAHSANC